MEKEYTLESLGIRWTIDTTAIAKGMLEMFSEEDAGPLAFGMLPAGIINCFEQELKEKYNQDCAARFDGLVPETVDDALDLCANPKTAKKEDAA